jgi:hypothetical protein
MSLLMVSRRARSGKYSLARVITFHGTRRGDTVDVGVMRHE